MPALAQRLALFRCGVIFEDFWEAKTQSLSWIRASRFSWRRHFRAFFGEWTGSISLLEDFGMPKSSIYRGSEHLDAAEFVIQYAETRMVENGPILGPKKSCPGVFLPFLGLNAILKRPEF